MSKTVILTGLRANNNLHIGNYFGALLPIVDMAKNRGGDYQINLFVPDLHSFTTPIDHQELYAQTLNNIRHFVAAGLPYDQPDVYIYRQSFIPAHSELTWILDCFTGVGEMSRMTQFKDKQAKVESSSDRVSMGLLNYPVLMAADILLYDSSYIPVGEDQKQHLEFTRDLAIRFNNQFGELLSVPKSFEEQLKFFSADQALRIRSLSDPTKKMSKSDDNERGVIFLDDAPEVAAEKVLGATTDSLGKINYDYNNQPGISNLLDLLALISGRSKDEVIAEWRDKSSYGDLKKAVADQIKTFLIDFQTKLQAVSSEQMMQKLESSEKAMNDQAKTKLTAVQKAVGLRE